MSLKLISPKNNVIMFLEELKEILTNPKFDLDNDLNILLKKRTELASDPYTTVNTMLALEYDRSDIQKQLLNLDISEYLETFIDDKDNSFPPFFAFGKSIKNRDVYIKVKIKDRENCKVFCVSFHFARYPFPTKRPYNNTTKRGV